jgi:hypothetical protein
MSVVILTVPAGAFQRLIQKLSMVSEELKAHVVVQAMVERKWAISKSFPTQDLDVLATLFEYMIAAYANDATFRICRTGTLMAVYSAGVVSSDDVMTISNRAMELQELNETCKSLFDEQYTCVRATSFVDDGKVEAASQSRSSSQFVEFVLDQKKGT